MPKVSPQQSEFIKGPTKSLLFLNIKNYSLRSTSRSSLDTFHSYSKRDSRKGLKEEVEIRTGPEDLGLLQPPLTGRKAQMEELSTRVIFT